MNPNSNITYIIMAGYVELDKYGFLYFLTMFTTYVLIICSNSTIVCLIWIHKNLHEPMYIFIAAVLINSVLFSTAIYPKCLLDSLSDTPIITHPSCLLQSHMFYSLGSSEYFLLAVMAYDRYVSICKPLQYANIMTRRNILALLFFSWLLPQCEVAIPIILNSRRTLCKFSVRGIYCNNAVNQLYCVSTTTNSVFGVFLWLNIIFCPVMFIIFTYSKIFIISHRSSREVKKKVAQTCLPHILVLISYTLFCTYDVVVVEFETSLPKTANLVMRLQLIMCHPLLNPIIYGIKMNEISKHLRKLFRIGKSNQ